MGKTSILDDLLSIDVSPELQRNIFRSWRQALDPNYEIPTIVLFSRKKEYIRKVLEACKGDKAEAERILGKKVEDWGKD